VREKEGIFISLFGLILIHPPSSFLATHTYTHAPDFSGCTLRVTRDIKRLLDHATAMNNRLWIGAGVHGGPLHNYAMVVTCGAAHQTAAGQGYHIYWSKHVVGGFLFTLLSSFISY
jgi:hypothetical protein